MSLGKVLDIAKNSLGVYQTALNVTSNNISNASNVDYTRQTIQFATEKTSGLIGGGVTIQNVNRVRNELIDKQLRSYNSMTSDADKRSTVLSQVESLLQEPTDNGISSYLASFYNSWQQLTVTPNSTALRSNVMQAASDLTNKFQSVYQGISSVRDDLVTDLKEKVSSLNDDLTQIQTLNRQIFESSTTNQDSASLKDERDRLVDEVSKLVNVTSSTNEQGDVTLSIGGIYAVDRFSHTDFQVNQKNGVLSISAVNNDTQAQVNSGEINAITDLYTNQIPKYLDSLDTIATSLMDSVNSVHSKGIDLNGDTGINFFTSYNNGVLEINSKIVNDNNKIAVSSDGTAGNGDIAKQIADLKNAKIINGSSVLDKYTSLVSTIGSDTAMSTQNATSNGLVLTQLQNQRASTSGVSLDEEMTNVIRFQRSYDASAKLIKVADEMLQTLIDMV